MYVYSLLLTEASIDLWRVHVGCHWDAQDRTRDVAGTATFANSARGQAKNLSLTAAFNRAALDTFGAGKSWKI